MGCVNSLRVIPSVARLGSNGMRTPCVVPATRNLAADGIVESEKGERHFLEGGIQMEWL